MNYFVAATLQVLQGGPLNAKETLSFNPPPIESQKDWHAMLVKTSTDVESLAVAIEQLPEDRLWEPFMKEEYGNYYRCLHGPIENCHYHLGQIAMLKIMIRER